MVCPDSQDPFLLCLCRPPSTMPTFFTLALPWTGICSSALPVLGLLEPLCHRELQENCTENCKHSGFTFQLDFVQRQMGEQVAQSSSHQIGIVVSCHSESRVPLKDLPSESLLPETTPVLGFSPFPILFPTLLLVFLGSFFFGNYLQTHPHLRNCFFRTS